MTEMLLTTIVIYSLIGIILSIIIFAIASVIFSKIFINELYKMLRDMKDEEE